MMAPVPYSISTKFPTQMGIFSPLKGLMAWRPVKKPSFSAVARSSVFTEALAHSRELRFGFGTVRRAIEQFLHAADAWERE